MTSSLQIGQRNLAQMLPRYSFAVLQSLKLLPLCVTYRDILANVKGKGCSLMPAPENRGICGLVRYADVCCNKLIGYVIICVVGYKNIDYKRK